MPDNNEFNRFLPEEPRQPDQLSIEIPAEQPSLHPDRIPSGYEPMGEIQLRGRAFGGLASGQAPWWVMFTGWAMFGGAALLLLHFAIAAASITAWLLLILALIPLLILWRGTTAKLSSTRRR